MTAPTPIVLVEDMWSTADGAQALLSRELHQEVKLATNFDEMVGHTVQFAEDSNPVIVLDPGIPGICRLEAVRATVRELPRARIIFWSAVEHPASYCGALLDGAYAAIPKRRPMPSLVRVINRVQAEGLWCEPRQAQWFLDFLLLLRLHSEGSASGTWKTVEVEGLPDLAQFEQHFEQLALGAPMPQNDGWLVTALKVIQPRWLPPRLRRAQMALAVHGGKRPAAAEACGIARSTMDDYASGLGGRLLPERYVAEDRNRDNALVRALSEIHSHCELSTEEHDLQAEAFA